MKLRTFIWSALDASERDALLQRPAVSADARIAAVVDDIVRQVRSDGDAALLTLTAKLDKVTLNTVAVPETQIDSAGEQLSETDRNAIQIAIRNVRTFHEAQVSQPIDVQTSPGVRCERIARPIDAVGLYVPSGSAPLPSAAIMMAVPADIAGCPRRVLCAPPRADGTVDPSILYVASLTGISEVFCVGGAQAIAALAYGTETVQRVSKIFGPGNAYVAEAKSLVARDPNGAAQDLPAGPSEVLVIADQSARADVVAADLLSQAEHGPDSQVVLLATDAGLIDEVQGALTQQLNELPRREIAAQALTHSMLIQVDSIEDAVDISNDYAPEHLIVNTSNARDLLPSITNAGSVFLGPWTPESLGDYCSGTNHVLPTYGFARNFSGLGVEQFQRFMTVQEASEDGLQGLGPVAQTLATLEGLAAHERAVAVRVASR
ncbi:MAG: histidinol dehydrogenase [Pseudomonadota bacterium]